MNAVLVAAALLSIPATAAAATRAVGVKGYPSIQSAIDASAPGDIINVSPGTYHENLRITKHIKIERMPYATSAVAVVGNIFIDTANTPSVTLVDLTLQATTGPVLRAAGWGLSKLANVQLSRVTVWFGSDGIDGMMNLTMNGGGVVYSADDGISITGTASLDGVSVFGVGGDGIRIATSPYSASIARIANTNVVQCGGRGIQIEGTHRAFLIDNVTVDEATQVGVYLGNTISTRLQNVTIRDTQPFEDWGDGLFATGSINVHVENASITDNARAGIASFTSDIHVRTSAVLRNAIDLNVEIDGEIEDLGGNRCTSVCLAVSSRLEPPDLPTPPSQ